MAIIPLRQYIREIEGLVDSGQLDEAIAHCRHILETFPKHIATYRLLAKAYLEQQRYGDGADIFQRVLSSIPDDSVANIGMSIIREDEGNLDAAIWYMERASESQPSNTAIKDELRRLYGRRDGIEPPKIRLTRGALARMYARGGLYDQAITELRSALVEDPQRPDLLVLLAQMYFQLGQQVEAVDTCGNLIKQLPYCLIANRILGAILTRTERADDSKTYFHRAITLDPYFSSAPPEALDSDAVPESAINIERLAYQPGQAAEGPSQPAWAASLGIAFEDSQAEQLPEWLQEQSMPELTAAEEQMPTPEATFSWEESTEEAASSDSPLTPEDAIPDWMKEAGWQPATGAAPELPGMMDLETEAEQSEGEIAKADIPEWLKGLAPSGIFDEEQPSGESKADDHGMPWLQQTTPGASDTIVNWLSARKIEPQGDTESEPTAEAGMEAEEIQEGIPDWLTEIQEPTPPTSTGSTLEEQETLSGDEGEMPVSSTDRTPINSEKPDEDNGLPEWLRNVESSYGRSGITDWLNSAKVDEFEAAAAKASAEEAEQEFPEWLKEPDEPVSEIVEPIAAEAEPEEGVLPAIEIPEWLQDLGQPVSEPTGIPTVEPEVEEIALPEEGLPEWLKEISEPTSDLTEVSTAEPEAERADIPEEEIPEWLKEMGEATSKPGEISPAEPETEEKALPAEELPEWLKEISAGTPEVTELISLEPEGEAVHLTGAEALPEEAGQEDEEELGEAAQVTAEFAPSKLEEPILSDEEPPDWLRTTDEAAAEAIEAAITEPEEATIPTDELPDWLKEIEMPVSEVSEPKPTEPATEEAALPAEDLPDWLQELEESSIGTDEVSPADAVAQTPMPFTDISDQDAALAWLESLAAQHGAKEEELITKPDERLDAMPDWIQHEAETIQAEEEETPTQPIPVEQQATLEEKPEEILPPTPEALDLNAEAPALPSEELPEWLKEMGELAPEITEVSLTEAEGTSLPEEVLPEWLKGMGESRETPEEVSEAALRDTEEPAFPAEELPEWLKEMGEPGIPAEEFPEAVEPEVEEPALSAEELPDWLKETGELPQVIVEGAEPEAEETALPAEELPEWLQEMGETTTPTDEAGIAAAPDLTDQDAALAWLESLAAQHGAKEEELITEPGERLTIMPDWVQQEADNIQVEDETPTQPVPVEQPSMPEEEVESTPESVAIPTPEDAESILAEAALQAEELPEWLKDIGEMIPESAELTPSKPEDEEPALPEEEFPEWLRELGESAPETTELAHSETEEELSTLPEDELEEGLPDWLLETVGAQEITSTEETDATPGASADTEGLPDWLIDTAPPDAGLADEVEELPDWLKETPQPISGEEEAYSAEAAPVTPAWMPEAILPEPPKPEGYEPAPEIAETPMEVQPEIEVYEGEPTPVELVPEVININAASLSELEKLPGIGFITAQKIIDHRETHGPFTDVEALMQITGIGQVLIDDLRDRLTTGIPLPSEEVPAEPETEESIFASARQAVERGNTKQAADLYNRLIREGADLDQVIEDMQTALYRYPLDIDFWQILGDTYLRTDKLQEALDAYIKAEELLR